MTCGPRACQCIEGVKEITEAKIEGMFLQNKFPDPFQCFWNDSPSSKRLYSLYSTRDRYCVLTDTDHITPLTGSEKFPDLVGYRFFVEQMSFAFGAGFSAADGVT